MGYQVDRRVYEPAEDSRLLCATLEKAVVRFPELRGCVLELGTGSGIVALMLASLGATVTATDLNPHAVALARSNAREQDLTIEFLQGDLFEPVGDRRFDAIVCNPPYLPPGGDYDHPAAPGPARKQFVKSEDSCHRLYEGRIACCTRI